MKPQEQLNRYRDAKRLYDTIRQEAEAIETMLTSFAIDYTKVIVQSTPSDWTETCATLIGLHRQCVKQLQECVDTMQEVKALIDKVKDAKLREVLLCKYILLQHFNVITASMGYTDERWVYRLHARALKEVEKILN